MAKHPGGRPTKYDPEKYPDMAYVACAEGGMTDKQLSKMFGVSEVTLNAWKNKYPKFLKSLKAGKAEHDDNRVEKSLLERACGYTCPETKAQWVESTEIKNGKSVRSGRWEYAEMQKHYPPDPTSMIFWLKNRQPEKWRDRIDNSVKIENIEGILEIIHGS